MRQNLLFTLIGITLWSSLPADAAEIRLMVSGQAYIERPTMGVFLDGSEVGRAQLSYIPLKGEFEEVEISVPDKVLRGASELSVRLINDKYEGEGKDINLWIGGLEIGKTLLAPDDFVFKRNGEPQQPLLRDGVLVLLAANEEAAIARPEGGWIYPPTCDASVTIQGFPRNLHDLSADQQAQVHGVVLDQAVSGECAIKIIGYASKGGGATYNDELSLMRANAVLGYLQGLGAEFESVQLEAGGETDQFGLGPDANRAVTVKLLPP